nr:MAG TPA: hypothetical protein [Caudoviricetes sp.]
MYLLLAGEFSTNSNEWFPHLGQVDCAMTNYFFNETVCYQLQM